MRPCKTTSTSVIAVLIIGAVVCAEDFTVIALPDTQFYSQNYPATYHAQTQWCVDNQAFRDIRFVTHLGDLVNHAATIGQWEVASAAMARLDNAGMPYGTCVGNHDLLYPGDYYDPAGTNYLSFFGPQYYVGLPWYGGASPSGLSNYQIIDAAGRDLLFLHICMETPAAELAWAQEVLNDHNDKPTMVSTHRYLFDWRALGQGRYGDFQYAFEPLYRHDGIKADDFFYSFVARNKQIYAVLCGHCDGEYRQVSYNSHALPVHEILSDYQNTYGAGGNGWLRILTYRPDLNRIDVESYSPTLDAYMTDDASQFSVGVDFDAYSVGNPTLWFQQGVTGYDGTRDTWVNEDEPASSYGNSPVISVDDDTTNGWWGRDYQGQGLIRFEDMVQGPVHEGDPEPTRLPAGATIVAATLTVNLANDTDVCDPEFYVYRMTRDWSESSTWDELGDGIVPGVDCASSWIAKFDGDNDPDMEYYRHLDVREAVQEWSDGVSNHGFAILPERVSGCDDGIDIYSSESDPVQANPETREPLARAVAMCPSLDVEFTYEVLNTPPTVTEALASSEYAVDEGDEVELSLAATDPNPLDPLVFRLDGVDVGYATGSGTLSHWILMADEGTYGFSAEVLDDEATVPAGGVSIGVDNVAPTITEISPDRIVRVNEAFDFSASAHDPGTLDVLTFAWDFDEDGVYDDYIGSSGEWSYETPGVRTVAVCVNDDDGGFGYGSFVVEVRLIPGDGDGDGDVDLDDYPLFQDCLTGPNAVPTPSGPFDPQDCLIAFDFNGDGDVDLFDFSPFSLILAAGAGR